MKEITIYLSDDGKVFNSKFECIEYELECILEQNGIKFFDFAGNSTIDASMAYLTRIETEISEEILDRLYSYCGATELPKTKGTWVLESGREMNCKTFCSNCSYYHNDYGEDEPCCHNNYCNEYGWVKKG